FDRAQYRQTAAREHQDVAAQPAINEAMELAALNQHRACVFHLMFQQCDELFVRSRALQVFGGHAEAGHVAPGKIDAVFAQIDCDILPEIGELQSATDQIGQPL